MCVASAMCHCCVLVVLFTAGVVERGFMTHKGNPDQQRAARHILKDYVSVSLSVSLSLCVCVGGWRGDCGCVYLAMFYTAL